MPDLRQATDIEAKWIEAKRELDRLEAIFAKVDKVNVLKPWYGQEEKARYFELVDAIKKQKAIIESLNKGIDPSAPTGADAELDALKTPPLGGGPLKKRNGPLNLNRNLLITLRISMGRNMLKGCWKQPRRPLMLRTPQSSCMPLTTRSTHRKPVMSRQSTKISGLV